LAELKREDRLVRDPEGKQSYWLNPGDPRNIEYECIDVDLLEGAEKEKVMQEVARHNPRRSFPTCIVDDSVVVGFNQERLREVLEL
jgi:glutaredoxin